jgi:hypothetical protein
MQRIRAYAIASCLALLGLAFVPQAKADEWNKSTTLKINEPTRIPGRVLQPGEYVLELTDNTLSNRNIVQIFNSDRTQLLDTVITVPRERTTAAAGSQFSFWEMPAGQPPALRTWYYPGENIGQEFTYPKDVASQIAQYNQKNVPAYAEESANLNTATVGTVTSAGEFRASASQPATTTTTTAQYQPAPVTAQPRTDEAQAYATMPGCPPSATTTTGQAAIQPQPVEQPTVTAQVLPPYPIPGQQTVTTQPCECPPSAAVTQPGASTTTTTTTTTTTQPQEQQPPEQQPEASTTTTVQPCPPSTATQPGVAVQPRTDEANEYYESQPANQGEVQPQAQPCECPPSAAVAQPGVSTSTTTTVQPQAPAVSGTTTAQPCPPAATTTVPPRTDEMNEYQTYETNEMNEAQPCECPPSAAVTQPGASTTTTVQPGAQQPGVSTTTTTTVQPQAPAASTTVQPCAPAATTQPRTDEMNEYQQNQAQPAAPAAAQPAPCQCPGITSPQMQTNTNTNTSATPMVDHMCCH